MDPNIQYDRTGIVYKIVCNTCKLTVITDNTGSTNIYNTETHNYVGMSRTSLHNHMLAHLKGQKQKSMSNPLHRHDLEVHSGAEQEYTSTIIATEAKIVRLSCNESLRIGKQNPILSMNKRNENGHGGVIRLMANRVTH